MITRDDIKDIYPLTPFQEGILYHDLIDQDAVAGEPRAYFQQLIFRIRGPLDLTAFEEAWRHVIGRHDILRTVFRANGRDRPLQIVLKRVDFALERQDRAGLSPAERDAALAGYAAGQRRRPFALDRAPLTRVGCLSFGPGPDGRADHGVVWDFHHILVDGWCLGLLQDELADAYQAFAAGRRPAPRPALQYASFVQWVEARRGDGRLAFWSDYLAGYETALDLPGQRPVPLPGPRDPRTHRLRLEPGLLARLGELGREQGVTASTLVQTLWGLVLAKHNNTRDVVFGSVASTRPPELAGSEAMVGPCIGMLPLRVGFEAGESFRGLLRRTRGRMLDWLDNVHCPLAEIQARSGLRNGLFSHYFVFENYPLEERFKGEAQELAPGVTVGDVSVFMASHYDFLIRALPPDADGMLVEFEYNARIVDPAAIEAIAGRLGLLAERAAGRPDEPIDALSLLDDAERALILDRWSRGADPVRLAATVPERRAAVVAAGGDRPAVRGRRGVLSHRQLQERAEALARHLHHQHGVGVGSAVAIHAEPGEPMLRGMLACLLLGAAFVPLDPALPAPRVRHMLADSYAAVILAASPAAVEAVAGALPVVVVSEGDAGETGGGDGAGTLSGAPLPAVPADAPAYIIYTSGTTGLPKGVRVGQASLLNYAGWLSRDLGIGPGSATALVTSAAFDLGYTGLFGALLLGSCLTLLDEDERRDPDRVMEAVVGDRLSFLKATPSYLNMLLASPAGRRFAEAEALELVLLGGEPQNFDDLGRLRALRPGLRILNHYGPTEATIGCVAGPLDDLAGGSGAPQRIGRPVAGARILLCDHTLAPVPPGVPGELVVGGLPLAQGYMNPTPADAARFTTLPALGGAPVYRTGDFALWQADGTIVFLGRRDDQIKVRGHRVSLSGVEAALRETPGVKDAVVLAERAASPDQGTELTAYLILQDGAGAAKPTAAGLRADLAGRLPEPMIPGRFVTVSRFPMTANGKIDRAALAGQRRTDRPAGPADAEAGTASATATEETLQGIWQEILFVERVGLDEDFFALGGHSIKAILMIAKVRTALKKSFTIRDLFENPTIRRLAARLDAIGGGAASPAVSQAAARPSPLLALRPAPAGAPAALFLPQALGTATLYKELAAALSAEVACWGVQCPGFDRDEPFAPSLDALAGGFAAQAATLEGTEPLRLVGWSFGAHLAVETARHLEKAGRAVRLVLIDAGPRPDDAGEPAFTGFAELRTRPYWGRVLSILMDGLPAQEVARLERLVRHNIALLAKHDPAADPIAADILAIEAMDNPRPAGMHGFADLTRGRVTVHRLPGDHYSLFHPPHVARVLEVLDTALSARRVPA
ncbi:non-ribosomal peptide synthetase [Azospirillum agricola]|uniref:non-ribosomal peptide synthetase n=1 Tax=Azospirillum agricola TaxID=1720247 RepID=UPI000A0F121B|nr:non-ribosomal peptide synthetase [Azospirillum agricola]SMH47682.1 AMP-binding enzyme C-terminal domain-containing protein [Azospirillum lipoferum]